jgi:hypothetical protein
LRTRPQAISNAISRKSGQARVLGAREVTAPDLDARQLEARCVGNDLGKGGVGPGTKIEWAKDDLFVIPSWFWHEHANPSQQEAILFSVHDFPAMKSLGIYTEQAHPEGKLPASH